MQFKELRVEIDLHANSRAAGFPWFAPSFRFMVRATTNLNIKRYFTTDFAITQIRLLLLPSKQNLFPKVQRALGDINSKWIGNPYSGVLAPFSKRPPCANNDKISGVCALIIVLFSAVMKKSAQSLKHVNKALCLIFFSISVFEKVDSRQFSNE